MIEFPDSQPALEDLKECLAKTDLRYIRSYIVTITVRLINYLPWLTLDPKHSSNILTI